MTPDERAALLLDVAQQVACDVRDDIAAAHRVLRSLDRIDLEGLAVVLAAMVAIDQPVLPWWQFRAAEVAQRRSVVGEALAPKRRRAA